LPPPLDLAQLLPSWQLRLRSEHKSPSTVTIYSDGVKAFLRWCDSASVAATLDRDTVSAFTAALLESGAEPATARSRQLSLKRFATWLNEKANSTRTR
jgi:site-specific recombinase XerD